MDSISILHDTLSMLAAQPTPPFPQCGLGADAAEAESDAPSTQGRLGFVNDSALTFFRGGHFCKCSRWSCSWRNA